ncbi:MAG TPA: hypothetical protein VFW73_13445 [Lacipirellulaceae bacterium]|nr:hypothetical protein [Lacipirellulaceae bacterium]
MSELLQEYVDSGSQRLRVDRAAGVIRGVKLLGLSSRNGRRYQEDALVQAVNLYEGAKVNINHPKGHPLSPRDYQDRLGVVRSVEFRAGVGLFGDLHFNPKHALSEQLVWDAEHAPQNVGMSHNVLARTKREGDETVVEAITKVQSIDLVADPATTSGLYEHAVSRELGVKRQEPEARDPDLTLDSQPLTIDSLTLEQLQHHRPELICEIEEAYESQLVQLRKRMDEMVAKERASKRRERVVQLLEEYGLPLPGASDDSAHGIISDQFMQTLMNSPDEETLHLLVEERVALVRSASNWNGSRRPNHRRPRSRDQFAVAASRSSRSETAANFAATLRG